MICIENKTPAYNAGVVSGEGADLAYCIYRVIIFVFFRNMILHQ